MYNPPPSPQQLGEMVQGVVKVNCFWGLKLFFSLFGAALMSLYLLPEGRTGDVQGEWGPSKTTGLSVAVGQCKCLRGECSGVLMMCSAALATHWGAFLFSVVQLENHMTQREVRKLSVTDQQKIIGIGDQGGKLALTY